MSLYLWLLVFTITFPLIRSFEPRVGYSSRWKALFPAIFLTAIFFIVWDIFFTKNGVWGFNERHLAGISLLHLPVEEWLFFIAVPFASVFIYDCVIHFDKGNRLHKRFQLLSIITGVILTGLAFMYRERDYTFYNFLFAGALLLLHGAVFRVKYMGHFYIAYLFHLLPFILVNGVLTGGLTEKPVVWYNNAENLGIRLWTIPIEDFVYALSLLLMNVTCYEFFKSKQMFKHTSAMRV